MSTSTSPLPDVSNIDFKKLSPKSGGGSIHDEPEFIPYNNRGRDIQGRIFFNTGVLWLGGFGLGGAYGFVEGWRNAVNPNYQIRFNSVMNALSRRGSMLGNRLGTVGFLHTSIVGILDAFEIENRTGYVASTPIFSGALTGALFSVGRSSSAMALATLIGTAVSCGYWYGGSHVYEAISRRGGRY